MQEGKNLNEIKIEDQKIVDNKELSIKEALIPVVFLMLLLAYNIFYADGVWLGDYSNQFILLIGGLFATLIGLLNKVSLKRMINEVIENWKSVFVPIMILFLVGALAGTWLVSGIIPDNGGLRRLTIREGLRLFGYPEWYEIPIKEAEAFDLLGNTVAVPVVEHVAKQLAEIYERNLVYSTVNETPVCS